MSFNNYFYHKSLPMVESNGKTAVFCFGRYQPPTKGHLRLMQKVHALAEEVGGDAYVFTSQTTDGNLSGKKNKGRNPLDWNTKNRFIKKLIPWGNISEAAEIKNPFNVINYFKNKGYDKVIFVAGSDRVSEFEERWIPYAKEQFNESKVISAGQRDPDSSGINGINGTKARHSAKEDNFAKFKIATGWDGEIAEDLMNAIKEKLPEEF